MPAARTVRATPAHPAPSAAEELHQAHRHDRNVGHHHQQRNLTNGARWRLYFLRRARRPASPVDSLQCGRRSEQRRPERGKLPGRSSNAFRRPGGGFGARQRHHQAACTDNGQMDKVAVHSAFRRLRTESHPPSPVRRCVSLRNAGLHHRQPNACVHGGDDPTTTPSPT